VAGVPGGEHLAERPGRGAQRHPCRGEDQRPGERAVGETRDPGHGVRQAGGQQHQAGRLPECGQRRPDQRAPQPGDAGQRAERTSSAHAAAVSACTGPAVSRFRNTQ
jgi:hypothetical protein